MNIKLENKDLRSAFIDELGRISGEEFKNCYQCGNCTAGCPAAYAMDVAPTQAIRLIQLGRYEDVLNANSIWVCVGCLQCYSRCPKGVSAANIYEALRQVHLRSKENHKEIKDVPIPFLKNAPQQAIVCGFRKFVG